MHIVGRYSIKKGHQFIQKRYPRELIELEKVIRSVDGSLYKLKKSREKTMPGRMLFSPVDLNKAFKRGFYKYSWKTVREKCEYPTEFYIPGYKPSRVSRGAFREMDFVKNKLGVEVQFGKYAFMVYNVSAKMTIFHKLKYINAGVEIVPVKELADSMSTGVSYFEQFVWDLEHRGTANIDIPVLVLGIDV